MKRKIRWRKDSADIKSATELYEPHHNSKYKTCMVQHGYGGNNLPVVDDYKLIQDYWLAVNGTRVMPVCIIKTLPDIDKKGEDVEGTGGRPDLFFFIHEDDLETMFDRHDKFGDDAPRWLEDIYYNEQGHLYPDWVEEWA